MQALSTAHGSYGRHIRFCYRNRQVTRWRSSWHDYCPDYGGWWPPQNLGRSSISRRSMVLSEGERTITTRSFTIGLHKSVRRWNNCVGATCRYRTTDRDRATNIGTPVFIHGFYCSIRSSNQPPTPFISSSLTPTPPFCLTQPPPPPLHGPYIYTAKIDLCGHGPCGEVGEKPNVCQHFETFPWIQTGMVS